MSFCVSVSRWTVLTKPVMYICKHHLRIIVSQTRSRIDRETGKKKMGNLVLFFIYKGINVNKILHLYTYVWWSWWDLLFILENILFHLKNIFTLSFIHINFAKVGEHVTRSSSCSMETRILQMPWFKRKKMKGSSVSIQIYLMIHKWHCSTHLGFFSLYTSNTCMH